MDIDKLYRVQSAADKDAKFDVRAKSRARAWAKFVALRFRGVALKPALKDYTIKEMGD